MKNLLTLYSSLAVLSLSPTTALAHTDHLQNETVHGFLHAEHLLMLAALGIVAVVVKVFIKK